MAESAISFAGRLGESLVQEGKFLHEVSGQIEFIQFELELMQMYLEDADKRQIPEKRVQTWISKMRETSYDVEDILETFLIKIASRRRGGIKKAFKRYACIIHEAAELHKVASQIEAIKTRITNLTRCLKTYSIKLIRECEEGHSSVIERQLQWRPFYLHGVGEYTVGLEGEIEKLVEELLNEEGRVVSICGMGGLGKTTLAKKVYHHQCIRRHFDCFAWVFISHQQFQPRNTLEGILFELISPSENQRKEILKFTTAELVEKLFQVQRDKKCLVILDDIWTKEAWDVLHCAFPVRNSGSKILLTSRYDEVAEHVDPRGYLHRPRRLTEEEGWALLHSKAFPGESDSRGHLHEPRCLTEEEGWSLLQKKAFLSLFNFRQYIERLVLTVSRRYLGLTKKEKAFPEGTDGEIDEDLMMLGRKMVKRCDGLPFSLAVLGGILATKRTKDQWKMVLDNFNSYLRIGKGHQQQQFGVHEVLALTYYELSCQLKPFFLYLGHFPEGFNIPTKKLVRMWVAEGLVASMQVKGAETLEEVAERYLVELVKRNMVQVGETGSTGRVKTCRLHNFMQGVCLSKANEKNFLEIVYNQNELMGGSLSYMVTNAKLSHRTHRIAIQYKEVDENFSLKRERNFLNRERAPYLRSLLVLGARVSDTKMVDEFCNFKLLRVLDLEPYGIGMLPRAIGHLIHLRYLNFKFGAAPKVIIPSSIGNLRFLQTLIINNDTDSSIFEVPNMIWKMKRLRHLCLPHSLKKNSVKLRLGNLRELQTLRNFDARNFDVKELTVLANFRKLKILHLSSLKELEGVLLISPSDSLNIGLRSLHIEFDSLAEETDLQRLLLSCHQLRKLYLGGKIVKLPEYSKFPPNLTKLSLFGSELEEDPMPTLEKLPNLTVLRLSWHSFKGKEMTCSANGFSQLRPLRLEVLGNLEEWCVQEEATRSLCKLEIVACEKLKMVPDGLRFITTLRELHSTRMPLEFQQRVKEGGEDYHKLKHVPSIILG